MIALQEALGKRVFFFPALISYSNRSIRVKSLSSDGKIFKMNDYVFIDW